MRGEQLAAELRLFGIVHRLCADINPQLGKLELPDRLHGRFAEAEIIHLAPRIRPDLDGGELVERRASKADGTEPLGIGSQALAGAEAGGPREPPAHPVIDQACSSVLEPAS